jgi:hypothetical protein
MSLPVRKLVLGRDDLVKWLTKPEIYEACPTLATVKTVMDGIHASFMETYRRDCCGGNRALLFPALDAFMALLRAAKPDAAEVSELRAFFASKLGYRPDPILIYYRKTSKSGVDKLRI